MKISFKNPLTKTYQYEYAMFVMISDMFASVECRSRCLESLKLYFLELAHSDPNKEQDIKKNSREGILREVRRLCERDVTGNITFPKMNICRAESYIREVENGTHIFTFTDGIYGFEVHIIAPSKKTQARIEVRDLSNCA